MILEFWFFFLSIDLKLPINTSYVTTGSRIFVLETKKSWIEDQQKGFVTVLRNVSRILKLCSTICGYWLLLFFGEQNTFYGWSRQQGIVKLLLFHLKFNGFDFHPTFLSPPLLEDTPTPSKRNTFLQKKIEQILLLSPSLGSLFRGISLELICLYDPLNIVKRKKLLSKIN